MRTATSMSVSALIVCIGLTGCAANEAGNPGAATATSGPTTAPTAAQSGAPMTTSSPVRGYRNGEYSATGWYGSLPSHHDVTLTLEDDVVTAVDITTPAEDETSLGYQERFAAALPAAVVGKDIDELNIDRLAGSSGCSEGFMDALAKIKDDAVA